MSANEFLVNDLAERLKCTYAEAYDIFREVTESLRTSIAHLEPVILKRILSIKPYYQPPHQRMLYINTPKGEVCNIPGRIQLKVSVNTGSGQEWLDMCPVKEELLDRKSEQKTGEDDVIGALSDA